MPAVRDLLDRFRPAGAPGAPSPAGVPDDRRASAAQELAPVFAALASTAAECAAVRADAGREAQRRAAAASERARALVARAHADAEAQRAAAAAQARQRGDAETRRIGQRADAEADAARREAERRRAALVERVLRRVRSDLARLGGGTP